jgi:O-antigen/teichoic acid export membrane protein
LIAAVLGFVYWFLISIFGGAGVVGIASSVYSLSALVSGIATLGVPVGVQRFLGRDFSQKNIKSLNTYFWTALIFTLVICLIPGIAIWGIALLNIPLMGFSTSMLFFAGIMTCLSFYGVITALFSSIIRTEYVAISTVLSAVLQVSSGVFLVYLGFGWLGAATGLVIDFVSTVTLMLFFARKSLKQLGGVKVGISSSALGSSLRAGSVNWLPAAIALLGQQLSFLSVFGLQGSFEAGTFYIAYSIFGIVYMLPSSFMSILFPILSGLGEERGEMAWRVLKLCFAFACPLTAFLMLYSVVPLSIMGAEYIPAATTLSLLAASTIPLTFVSAVYNLVYSSGSYGKVFGIGLALNVPRVILYFLLVPIYSGMGAALSFLTGALVGLGAAIVVSWRIHFRIARRKVAVAIAAPFTAALVCLLLGLSWLVGGAIIILVSVPFYGRLGVVERSDLAEIARSFTSEKTIARAGERLNRLLRIIYGE